MQQFLKLFLCQSHQRVHLIAGTLKIIDAEGVGAHAGYSNFEAPLQSIQQL